MRYKEDIYSSFEKNKFFFITGNALELFGKCMIDSQEKKIKCLHLFDFYTKQEKFRMVDEALVKAKFLKVPILGFQNQNSVIKSNDNIMFELIHFKDPTYKCKRFNLSLETKAYQEFMKNYYAEYL